MNKKIPLFVAVLAIASLTGCQKSEPVELINKPAHFISVDTSIKNAKLKVVSRNEEVYFAQEGDLLFINAVFDYGYELDHFLLNNQILESAEFTMPSEDIYISVVTKHVVSHIYLLDNYGHGTISVNKTEASYADLVNITVTPEEGYMCLGNSIKLNTTPLYRSPITKPTTFSFAMPSEDVTIYAEFVEVN